MPKKHTPAKKKLFSIPYNGDLRLLNYAVEQGCVQEVYFPGPERYDISLTSKKGPFSISEVEIKAILKICADHDINSNLLCNTATLIPFDISKILAYISSLKGLTSVTISDVSYLPMFKKALPGVRMDISFIANIDNADKASQAARAGADVICIGNELNRDLKGLLRIRDLKKEHKKLKIKTLVSDACSSSCLYFSQHYTHCSLHSPRVSSGTNSGSLFDQSLTCHNEKYLTSRYWRELIRHPFIRPEDLDFYVNNGLADIYKITNRTNSSATLRSKYDSYFSRTCTKNDLFDLYTHPLRHVLQCDAHGFPDGFLKKVIDCDRRCTACGYCEQVAKITISERERVPSNKSGRPSTRRTRS